MIVQDIIESWLKENGYDGLYDDRECGCLLEDLIPCGGDWAFECQPGYKNVCGCPDHNSWRVSSNKKEQC